MRGWVIRGVHVGDCYPNKVFHLGVGGYVVNLDDLSADKVWSDREKCRRKMCAIRKINNDDHEEERCIWSVKEVFV